MEVVGVLGASSDSERYSNKAMRLLKEYGHKPIPIHPREKEILGEKVHASCDSLVEQGIKIDTLTMYVNPELSKNLAEVIIRLAPRRVIFNPGTENPELEKKLNQAGIKTEEACTLVLLRTEQY